MSMPNLAAQKVFSSGITIRPLDASWWNTRSASETPSRCSDNEKPFGDS
jgi:hypothetical protein